MQYSKVVERFYEASMPQYFKGENEVRIYFKKFLQARNSKAIMISSGRTEAALKYKELIYDLYKNGFSVYIHDHRGQGLSGRMTADSQMGYVDDFQYYVDDMKAFYENHVKPNDHDEIYLLAHSMGGAIGMTYLQQFPTDFKAAVFSSPMLGLNPPICSMAKLFDPKKPKYAVGEGAYKDGMDNFSANSLTTSEIRYRRMLSAYNEVPEARLGGATYKWVKESCDQFGDLFDNIVKIQTPFVLFSASDEEIVSKRAHRKFAEEADKAGKASWIYYIEDARHELFIEKDIQRQKVLNTTLDFFQKY